MLPSRLPLAALLPSLLPLAAPRCSYACLEGLPSERIPGGNHRREDSRHSFILFRVELPLRIKVQIDVEVSHSLIDVKFHTTHW